MKQYAKAYRFFAMILATLFSCPDAYATDAVTNAPKKQGVVLGILEDVPGVYAGEDNSYAVRVVFQKDGESWQAFPSWCPNPSCLETAGSKYPSEVTWNIAFDGRSLGQVTARTPKGFKFYGHIGLQEITSSAPIPVIGKRAIEYGGYSARPVYRPLVANSQPYFKDPESWKPTQLSSDYIKLLRQQFRQKFPRLCKNDIQDETKLEPFPYHDEDVKVTKTFASKRGWILAQLRLKQAIDCDDTEAGFEIYDQWFAINPQKSVQYLDEGMWLVDAGDYDNSGKDALVFSIDRDNRGGYELFYDDFEKHAIFEFGYH